MAKVSTITEPYFSHDISTRQDKSIKKLIFEMGYEGYGLFWAIVEFMHRNELKQGEEYLILDEKYVDNVVKILNDYGLFYVQDGCYVSDRILRNINHQEEKTKQSRDAVSVRWLLSAFDDEYEKVFGEKPILGDGDINALKKYNKKIPDLKIKLSSIFKTLSKIKFDTTSGFLPRANWLLAGDNLLQVINGQYGKLASTATDEDAKKIIEEEKQRKLEYENISSRESALDYAVKYSSYQEMLHNVKAQDFMNKWNFTIDDYLEKGGRA